MAYQSLNLWALAFAMTVTATASASTGAVTCPQSVVIDGAGHGLVNASIYDGFPGDLAQLVPSPAGALDRWDVRFKDTYLVCKFQGTFRVVALHAIGATSCEAGMKPFRASCRP